MEFDSEIEQMEFTTLRLSSNFPSLKVADQMQSPAHPGMLTPPLYATTSRIPFLWEVKPGKPKPINVTQNALTRSLDLPPRLLLSEAMMTKVPSPTTVLEGPLSLSFRAEKGQSGHLGGSRRGFRIKGLLDVVKGLKEYVGEGSFVFSSTGDLELEDECVSCTPTTVETAKIRKHKRSHFLDRLYESLKQMISWRRRKIGKDSS